MQLNPYVSPLTNEMQHWARPKTLVDVPPLVQLFEAIEVKALRVLVSILEELTLSTKTDMCVTLLLAI